MSVASLRMYDLAEFRGALEAWWSGLARHLRRQGVTPVPDRLSQDADHRAPWRRPDLCLAQTCGYPLTHDFRGLLTVIATPCYTAPGCEGSSHRSLVVVGEDHPARTLADLRGAVAAYNSRDSNSGYNVLRAMLAPHARGGRFLARSFESGSHVASLLAVQQRRADLAAIDCVTYALGKRHRPQLVAGLRVVAEGPPTPSLPYVTAGGADPEQLARYRAGLMNACADDRLRDCRDALLLAGAELIPEGAYEEIGRIEQAAIKQGYPELG
ncbi:MAG: PhnD/SsuA/transferrin family substrate-binding protein [Proteobacteria bacterium]|nr:PhnD/SsuA/transferrin family substrate-binding protein [Pseudomonadota bacterium]MBI3497231.1 PhnD/SsuA/transferrin family substrate-binding protein [Pseudomonadota bacterium]